jgi:hypothetical protein
VASAAETAQETRIITIITTKSTGGAEPGNFNSVVLLHASGCVREHAAGVRREGFGDANNARDRAASGNFRKHFRNAGDLTELRNLVHWVLVDGEALAVTVTAVTAHVERRAIAVDGLVVCARFIDHAAAMRELVPAQDVTKRQ